MPKPNWCPTCNKRPDDPEAIFCSNSFHKSQEGPGEEDGPWAEGWKDRVSNETLWQLVVKQDALLREWEANAVTAAKTELGKLVVGIQGTGTSLLERTRRQLEVTRIKLA